MDSTFGQSGWWCENVGQVHTYAHLSQLPRNSTFSSECSSAAPSVFSDAVRYSQALSVASSQTNHSSSSAQSASSGSSAYPNASRPSIRPNLKEKKVTNPHACSHCNETFSKRADRKKHILDKCPYLGPGSLCSFCLHIGRNKHQVDKHQRSSGHRGPCTAVDAKHKHAFTCSNDGRIYASLEQYINHFSSERCHLNRAGATRHHRSRLRTLLSEGRDDINGHSYIYAALVDYCHRKTLLSGLNDVIDRLSEEAAQAYAERLEWGCMPKDGTPQTRLGYTSFEDMVDEIMTWSDQHTIADATRLSDIHAKSDQHSNGALQQQASSPRRCIPQNPATLAKPLPKTPVKQHPRGLQSAAVTEASAMLREDLILRNWPEQYNVGGTSTHQPNQGYKAKRPRSLATSQQQETTIRAKSANTQSSPVRHGRQIIAVEQMPSTQRRGLEEDLEAFMDWPEQFSLTPPLTAHNLSFATRTQMDFPSTRTSEKRHAGIWEWSVDDFVSFEHES